MQPKCHSRKENAFIKKVLCGLLMLTQNIEDSYLIANEAKSFMMSWINECISLFFCVRLYEPMRKLEKRGKFLFLIRNNFWPRGLPSGAMRILERGQAFLSLLTNEIFLIFPPSYVVSKLNYSHRALVKKWG